MIGRVNQCYISCFFGFGVSEIRGALTKIGVAHKFGGAVSWYNDGRYSGVTVLPMYGLDNLLSGVNALLELNPIKGVTDYWNPETLEYQPLTID